MLNGPSLAQRLATIRRRGWASTDLEAMAVLRCLRAVERGGNPLEAIARPAYRSIPTARRVELVRTVEAILRGWAR
jgi:hypothetical protein